MTTILFAAIPPALGKPSPSQSMLLLFFYLFSFFVFFLCAGRARTTLRACRATGPTQTTGTRRSTASAGRCFPPSG